MGWEPRSRRGGAGGLRLLNLPGRKAGSSSTRELSPVPGRLVVFFSQEIEHEVLPSDGERFVITQWVWDVKRDERGR